MAPSPLALGDMGLMEVDPYLPEVFYHKTEMDTHWRNRGSVWPMMSHQAASDVQPKVRQARHQHNEQWYSTNLAMIKEHLMRVFMVDGDPPQVDAIKKKTCP